MCRYETFTETLAKPGIGEYTAYGIAAYDENRKELIRVSDVSSNKSVVESLTALCNKEHLDPVHVYDVIEDFLYG